MAEPSGIVFRIARYSVHDGPGIRTTVFLKGCPLRCVWCHSPESQRRGPELLVNAERCVGCGRCLHVCPHGAATAPGTAPGDTCRACGTCVDGCPGGARQIVGTTMSVAQVIAEIERDRLFYDESGGGVTFSGGEPLFQPAFLAALVDACRAREIRTAVDTTGYAAHAPLEAIRPDLFLYDLKLMDDFRHRRATGVSNRRILANARRLVTGGASVRFRFPLVPDVNDDEENLLALGEFVRSLGHASLDLLPYHRAGLAKYARLNRPCWIAETPEADEAQVAWATHLLDRNGVTTHVGG